MGVRCYYIALSLVIAGFGREFSSLKSRIQVKIINYGVLCKNRNVSAKVITNNFVLYRTMIIQNRRSRKIRPVVTIFFRHPATLVLCLIIQRHAYRYKFIAAIRGISSQTFPWNSRPFAFLLRFLPSEPHVPHCLKKKATLCASHCCCIWSTHSAFKGLA